MPANKCPELERLRSLPLHWQHIKEEMEHDSLTCHLCLLVSMREKIAGRELLFSDHLPQWIQDILAKKSRNEEESGEKIAEEAETTKPGKKNAKAPKKLTMAMTPEEIEQHLKQQAPNISDGMLVYQITKFMRVSKKEAYSHMARIRREVKKVDGDSPEKIRNVKKAMPWCPSINELYPYGVFSVISSKEQTRVVAMLNSLLNSGTFRHAINVDEFKSFLKTTEKEREELNFFVLELMQLAEGRGNGSLANISHLINDDPSEEVQRVREVLPPAAFKPLYYSFHPFDVVVTECVKFASCHIAQRWQLRQQSFKNKYSEPVVTIEWGSAGDADADLLSPRLLQTLNSAKSHLVMMPDLTSRCELSEPFKTRKDNYVKIFEDPELPSYESTGALVVMDATTFTHLMCSAWEGNDYNYEIPFFVKPLTSQGMVQKQLVLGKPMPLGEVSRATIQRRALKCKFLDAYVSPEKDTSLKSPKMASRTPQVLLSPRSEPTTSASNFDDPLSHILQNFDLPSSNAATNSSTKASELRGYEYKIFEVGAEKVLVRTRPAYICKDTVYPTRCVGHSISITTKVEYFPSASAMCLSQDEWLWSYCKKLLKNSDVHALIRVHFGNSNVLQVDCETMSVDSRTLPWAKQLISDRTSRVASLLRQLRQLEYGDYKLCNLNDGKLQIARALSEDAASPTEQLQFSMAPFNSPSRAKFTDSFKGFESNIFLKWQTVQCRAPGVLIAEDSLLWKNISVKDGFYSKKKQLGLEKANKEYMKPNFPKRKRNRNKHKRLQEGKEEQKEVQEQNNWLSAVNALEKRHDAQRGELSTSSMEMEQSHSAGSHSVEDSGNTYDLMDTIEPRQQNTDAIVRGGGRGRRAGRGRGGGGGRGKWNEWARREDQAGTSTQPRGQRGWNRSNRSRGEGFRGKNRFTNRDKS